MFQSQSINTLIKNREMGQSGKYKKKNFFLKVSLTYPIEVLGVEILFDQNQFRYLFEKLKKLKDDELHPE